MEGRKEGRKEGRTEGKEKKGNASQTVTLSRAMTFTDKSFIFISGIGTVCQSQKVARSGHSPCNLLQTPRKCPKVTITASPASSALQPQDPIVA